MKILKMLILLCFTGGFSSLVAQENIKGTDFIDAVYMKNGSVFRGNIIQYDPAKNLILEILSDKTLTLPADNILKIKQEILETAMDQEEDRTIEVIQETKPKVYAFKEKGWYNVTYVSSMNGKSLGDLKFGVGLYNVTGFMWHRKLGVGIGIGVENYAVGEAEMIYPIFAEARGYLKPTIKSWYYVMTAGYGLAFRSNNNLVFEAKGGYLIHPAIGLRFGAKKESNFLVDIGYKFQKASFTRQLPFSGEINIKETVYKRLTLRMGLLF